MRGVNANTDDNKEARVQAIETLNGMIRGGYRWVCLDESSWCVATTAVYGWSKRGERCFVTKGRNGIRITSIATIDATGMGDCFLVCGSSDCAVFEASLKRVMKSYDDMGVRAVFWCDNCSIHSGIHRIVNGTVHCVVFNAPDSSELNPVENVFGIWKRKAEESIRVWDGLDDFLQKIKASFLQIEPHEVLASMERCRSEVWAKVVRREDL